MPNQILPVYSIGFLQKDSTTATDCMAESFAKYMEEHPNLHFPHKHNFYHLVYFASGSGSHSIDFTRFEVTPGQIYFMIPGQVHSWEFDGTPTGYIVNFSEQFFLPFLAQPGYVDQFSFFSGNALDQVIQVPSSKQTEIESLLKTVAEQSHSDTSPKDDLQKTLLLELFIRVSRLTGQISTNSEGYHSVMLKNFRFLIEQHYKQKQLPKEYAAMLFVTPNYLNALTKAETGRSAGELIRDRVILEAKRLLVNAKLSITQIADELNFDDNSYFSKFFKKYAGVAPEAFRRQFIKHIS